MRTLKQYGDAHAARITRLELYETPGVPGVCGRLWFDDIRTKAQLVPAWVLENKPEVGGYFVVPKDNLPIYMSAEDFQSKYGGE
jgi:hypothetical protein